MYENESWIRARASLRLGEEGTLRCFLRELEACRRIRHVHQEVLLGLHVVTAERELRSIAAVAEGLRYLQSVTPANLLVQVRPSDWALELARARTDWIYSCEESKLHDFLSAAERAKDERLLNAAYDVAEGLAAQSTEVLSRLTEGTAQDASHDIPQRNRTDSAVEVEASLAQEKLIVSYVGYALRTARKYVGRGIPYLDLVHEGITGLIEAAQRYSPREGRPFKQVATTWAWQRIEKALADQGRTVRLPGNVYRQVRQCEDGCVAALHEGVVTPGAIDVLLLSGEEQHENAEEMEILSTGRLSSTLFSRFGGRIAEVERLLEFAVPPDINRNPSSW